MDHQASNPALAARVDALSSISKEDLRSRWAEAYKVPLPLRASREFLERSLAYRIQEEALGGLNPGLRKQLARLAGASESELRRSAKAVPDFKPGTRLIRAWQGEVHEVEVSKDGFSWQGRSYSNLSRIAREITGTRWSGPLFFGLKERNHAPVHSMQAEKAP
jgi:hypothetical protein